MLSKSISSELFASLISLPILFPVLEKGAILLSLASAPTATTPGKDAGYKIFGSSPSEWLPAAAIIRQPLA